MITGQRAGRGVGRRPGLIRCADILMSREMEAVMWDPGEYQRFAGERGRPFFDLLARVRASDPRFVADLGCGPGNLTAALASRWPGAEVVGVDNSAEMIGAALA